MAIKRECGEPLWTLSGDGITVYFNTYVLAPYASGEQAVSLSFTEYPELIRKQYQKNSDQWVIPIAEDEICLVDLDGDGAEEEISYSADRDEYDYADSIVIHCDGNSYDTEMFYGLRLLRRMWLQRLWISDPDTERENMAVSGNNGRR